MAPTMTTSPDLDHLRDTLAQALRNKLRPAGWGEPELMTDKLNAVRLAFNRPDAIVSARSVARSLLAFRLSRSLPSFHELKAACHGLAREADWGGRRMIEEDGLFANLLRQVDAYLDDPRRYRKCYRGLLASYFGYPLLARAGTVPGRANWEKLRLYLVDNLACIQLGEALPQWVEELRDNPCLLGADLMAIRDTYHRQPERFEQLAADLGIAANTWAHDLVTAKG